MDNYKCYIDGLFEKLDNKLKKTAVKSRNKLPYTTKNGVHDNRMDDAPDWWTNGFWGGMMWLMYNATGNQEYKIAAQKSEQLLDTAFLDYDALHHNVGFMWHLTSGANYRLTGDKKAYKSALYIFKTTDGYVCCFNCSIESFDCGDKTISFQHSQCASTHNPSPPVV